MRSSFLKPLSGQAALIKARVIRAGQSVVFGQVDMLGADGGKSVSRFTATDALL